MDVPQIKDREHLEAWLKTRSREECIAIAHRAAMRVAPLWIGEVHFSEAFRSKFWTPVVFLRAGLVSGVAPSTKLSKIEEAATAAAATSARAASDCLYPDAADAASYACATADSRSGYAAAVNASYAVWLSIRAAPTDVKAAVRIDFRDLSSGADLIQFPLWHKTENPLALNWNRARADLVARGPDWNFWVRWYDAALRGEPMDWKVQEEIALLPSEVWEGDVAGLAAAIAKIERKHARVRKPRQAKPKPDAIDEMLESERKGTTAAIAKVKKAIDQNHRELPATFDAVLGFISLEVQRLQQKNYQTDIKRDEAIRQIEVLTILDAAVRAILDTIPAQAPIDLAGAEKVEKLSRLFARKFGEWPRANADDLVDSTCRFALIGAVTCLAPLIGVPALSVFIGAGAIFGGRKIVDAVKSANLSKALSSPPS